MGAALEMMVALAMTSTAASEPGAPNYRPSDSALAALPPIVPIVTAEGTTFRMTTIVPVVTGVGTTLLAARDPDDPDEPAEANGSTIRVLDAPPDEPSIAAEATVPEGPPPVTYVVADPPPPKVARTPWSFGLRFETGFFSPEDINAELIRRFGQLASLNLLGGIGAGVEYRATPVLAVAATGTYTLSPPQTVARTTVYFHSVGASLGARIYIPTVETLDIAMGADATLRWVGFDGRSGVGAGFIWRFGVQLREKGLPIVLATLFFRRSKATDGPFELDVSGIGAMVDFSWDL